MATRTILFADDTIGALQGVVGALRAIDMTGSLAGKQIDAACLIFDVLEAAGLPLEGIRLVLGPDMEVIDGEQGEPMKCCQCEEAAYELVAVGNGSWRLACHEHARAAEQAGHLVITPRLAA